jgi:site-specific DNA-methyltransferase (adenine-specific)
MDLMKGDCLELMKGIPDGTVDMVLCDLPYGTTQNKWDSVIPLDLLWAQYKRICNGAIVLTAGQPFTSLLVMSNLRMFKYVMAWDKTQVTGFLNSKKQPLRRHEDVAVFYSKQPTYNPQFTQSTPYAISRKHATESYGAQTDNSTVSDGRRFPTSVIDIPQVRVKGGHPTQKPVALMEYLIRTYTNEGMTVLDNCMGSGTTGVACVNTGRKFIGIEMDDGYFEIAQKRIAGAIAAKDLERAISVATLASAQIA